MSSACAIQIRHASAADESGVRACVDAAYGPYVKRIGKPPAPMLDDYAALIRSEVVHVATSDGRLVGEAIAEGYRRVPETAEELHRADENARALVTEEPR
ncbi:MAG: hypothetical protein OXB92_12710 [Acidimicrobiaceae bacterium]|nr:hypothetical protein [Acidimicrobiia bacterium]MCY4494709.1 hypothetical protein [Acidimicrobiaceae bacterium]